MKSLAVRYRDLIAVVFLAIVTVFWGIGSKSLWLDEVLSLSIVSSWQHLWSIIAKSEPYQWSYLILLYVWKNGGMSEGYLRSLSAVFAVATIPVTYALGYLLFGRRAGLLAALFLALNMFFVRYGQEVRGASMLLFFTAASSYCFVRYLIGKEKKWLIGYILTSIAAFYTHQFAIFTLASQYLALLRHKSSKEKYILIRSLSLILVALIPLARIPIPSNAIDWIVRPSGQDIINFFIIFAGGHALLLFISSEVICFSLIQWRNMEWRYLYVLFLLTIPIGGAFLLSFLVTPMFVPRYLIATLVAWNIMVALGVSRLPVAWRLFGITSISLLSVLSLLTWYRGQDTILDGFVYTEKEDWRDATFFLLSRAKKSDAVVFYAYFVDRPFTYYLSRYQLTHPEFSPPNLVNISSVPYTIGGTLPSPDYELLASFPLSYPRVWLMGSHDKSKERLRSVQARDIRETLGSEYPFQRSFVFSGVTLTLFEKNNSEP